nr:MAG TPA: Ead/Ea22-like protein [Caudoviricetes sp.]
MDKLSELSKPVGFIEQSGMDYLQSGADADIWPDGGRGGDIPLYSQEYVSALLAELEAKDKRIVALERINQAQDDHINQQQDRIDSLEKTNAGLGQRLGAAEKRLATPVRLPDVLFIKVSGSAVPVMHAGRVKERLRAAGFTVEGGEQ